MSSIALVRDSSLPNNYHAVIVDPVKFEAQATKTKNLWDSMSANTKVGIVGITMTTVGAITWISSAANGNSADPTGISLTGLGLLIDVVACCLCVSK